MAKARARPATTGKGVATGDPIDGLIVRAGTGKQAPAARVALREVPAEQLVPRLLAAMADPRPKVRGFAYETSTGTPELRAITPLAMLIAGLGDPDPGVRLSVLACLNRGWGPQNAAVYASRGAEIRDALAPLLGDPDRRVKSQSAIVWGRLGLGALPA